ncbi:MAG: hypothetical protein WCL08_07540 [Verrucomicrobiota bacterium]
MQREQRYAALIVPRFRLQSVLLAARMERLAVDSSAPVDSQVLPSECDAAIVGAGEVGGLPAALVDGRSARGVLVEVNAAAERFGVDAGMVATQAMARCAQLVLQPASEAAEAALGARLLQFVETLSPRVEMQASDCWMVDLRGRDERDWTLWGEEMLRRLRVEEGIEARLGVAPRPGLALCAARRAHPVRVVEEAEAFVEELRFHELGVSDLLCRQLHDWGLSTLGDLLRLPRQATLERLGPEVAALWEIARDSRESVLRLESFPEPLELEVEFEHPVESLAPILFAINRMLEQICSRMRLLHRVASGMWLRLMLDDAAVYERSFTVPAPTREEAVLLRILETHLETLHFETSLVGVALKFEAALPASQQLALFENPLRDPNRFGETLARLRALVGEGRVGVPAVGNTHRPDSFVLLDPTAVFCAREPAQATPAIRAETMHRMLLGLPLRRFRPSLAAQVRLESYRPAHVASCGVSGPVLESRGPFRLSGDWWDCNPWQSEEWDVRLGGAGRGLYRLCLQTTTEAAGSGWFIEGCYDAEQWPVHLKKN